MTSSTPALIGLAGLLVGAALTAVFAAHRERVGRRDKAQQEALYALQDACLAHRQAHQALKVAQDAAPSGPAYTVALAEIERTGQVLDVTEARVLCDVVLERVSAWKRIVKPAILRDDKRNIAVTEEVLAWKAIQERVREELRWLSSRRTR